MATSEMKEGCPKTAIIVGAGNRGHIYGTYATYYPQQFKIVGVCEPRAYQRQCEQKIHQVPSQHVFADWTEAAKLDRFADSVMICTRVKQHKDSAIAFAKKGYHILLEKPIAVTEDDCKEIVKVCQENNVFLFVCHVLRYTPWVKKVKDIIDSGEIGDVVNINHIHPNGILSFTHYSVRGPTDIAFFVGASCHDVDLIRYWLAGKICQKVSAFGHLCHFKTQSKPKGAASRCTDCPVHIEANCPYSAKKLYLEPVRMGTDVRFITSQLTDVVDIEHIEEAIRNGPYGKCVYDNDNHLVSNQVVNMQFEGGVTATIQLVAFTNKLATREVKFYGTKGEMTVKDGSPPKIKVCDFITKRTRKYSVEKDDIPAPLDGYGGANFYCMKTFVDALHEPAYTSISTGNDALDSHLLTFAAEKARKENRVVNMMDNGDYD